jgi:predicted ATP-binding protein involved in virulence
MKIRKLQLKNIGVFDDETIEFKKCPAKDKAEIHILTGENGSGKTTILMALASLFRKSLYDSFEKRFRDRELLNECVIKLDDENDYVTSVTKIRKNRNTGVTTVMPVLNPYSNSVQKNKKLNRYVIIASSDDKQVFSHFNLFEGFEYALFAYSGYRRIKDEPIEIGKEINENPLQQALEFVKDEKSKFTVNQWLGQNLLNNSLAQTKKKLDEAKIFDEKIKRFEKVINDIIVDETKDNKIRFEMQSAIKLVLIKNEQELDFDVLPDGLKSLISWIGDLLMRLDSLKWENDTPIFDREIILFLDEIEVHLHPAWQRKVLPIVQKLFKNAQIFVSTHSPFVVNSVDDAWVYKLKLDENGKATIEEPVESENSNSITQVLREVFGIEQWFGLEVQNNFEKFKELKRKIIANGTDKATEEAFLEKARNLADEPNDQLKQMVRKELEELSEIKKKPYIL